MSKNTLYKIGGDICMLWWAFWSNIRFKDAIRENKGVKEEDKVKTLDDIQMLVVKLYKRFKWTKDGADQLYDAITPPPQNYEHYLSGILKDDCDGFHSLVYHCLQNSGIKCWLLTANIIGAGHCILIFKLDDKWYVNDYVKIYDGYATAKEAIEAYNKIYPTKYKHDGEVIYNGLIKYNYASGKFFKASMGELK